MTKVLVIDDDIELFELLASYLEEEGFSCHSAGTAETGLEKLQAEKWDITILDVMLPGMSGFEVLRRIRSEDALFGLPVLMLTARGEEIDRVVGLEMGADDYLPKPFSSRELVARLRALLRRSSRPATPCAAGSDDLVLHKASLSVLAAGQHIELSVSEMRLLESLLEKPGEVISRDYLYRLIIGHAAYPMDRSLDMLVSRVRKKLGLHLNGSERIKAVRGEGYIYIIPEAQA